MSETHIEKKTDTEPAELILIDEGVQPSFLQRLIHDLKTNRETQMIAGVLCAMLLIPTIIFAYILMPSGGSDISDAGVTPTPIATTTPEDEEEAETEEEEEDVTPTVTKKPTSTPTPKPTTAATQTPAPTSVPATATPTPTPAPTRIPGAPKMKFTYPANGQVIQKTSDEKICLVDVPDGGNQEGLQRRHNLNATGYTQYADHFTYCFNPAIGQNTLQLQYRNKYGEESPVYEIPFTYEE